MAKQFGQQDTSELTRLAVIWASIIHNASLRSDAGDDHGMPGRGLAELAVKQQVAGLGLAHIAAHSKRIELDQCFGVGKLRKGAVLGIIRLKGAWLDAEQPRAEWSIRIVPGHDLPGQNSNIDAGRHDP